MKKSNTKSLQDLSTKKLNDQQLTTLKGGTTDTSDTTDNIGTQDVVDI